MSEDEGRAWVNKMLRPTFPPIRLSRRWIVVLMFAVAAVCVVTVVVALAVRPAGDPTAPGDRAYLRAIHAKYPGLDRRWRYRRDITSALV